MTSSSQPEPITWTYAPDIGAVKAWLNKMIAERRFIDLVVAILALIVRLRDLNTELMRRLANLSRKRPPSERLARLECQLQLPLPGLSDDEQRDQSLKGGRKKQRKRRKQKRPGRNPLPAHLERVEQLNPVPDEMRNCPICNKSMPVIGYETSESLDVRPAQLFVCVRKDECVGCQTHGVVVSAPPPNRIMPRGKLSDTFIVEALADKYLLHLPIERQCARWAQYGIDLAPNTLGRSVAAAIDLLGPVASGIIEQGRASEIFSGDATGLRVLDPEAPEGRRTGTMWCGIGNGRWVSFFYWPDGKSDGAMEFLGDRDPASIVQSDGTTVMNFIERRGGKRAGCWAHARRKLVEAARKGDTLALEGLRIIARLFVVERISQICDESPEQRKARRQQHSTMVLDELRAWVDQHRGYIPPKSPLGKALKYIHRQWPRLVLFLEDGRIELTNNHVERALRTLVLGLKNWLFTYEDVGASRVATILTVLGTCIAQQVNPRLYLHAVLERIVNGRPGDELGDLLPDRLAEQLPALRLPIRDGPDEQRLTETIAELEAALEPKTRVPQLGPKAS